MKSNKTALITCIAIPLLAGSVAGLLSGGGIAVSETLIQPPLSPPGWLFPVAWTLWYVLMGIASYLILTSGADDSAVAAALSLYGYQLAANFLWPVFFFDFGWYFFSFLWLVLLWVLIALTIRSFYPISKTAARLMVPYFLWVTFAGYLNFGIWWLNGNTR